MTTETQRGLCSSCHLPEPWWIGGGATRTCPEARTSARGRGHGRTGHKREAKADPKGGPGQARLPPQRLP
eukprot:9718876-Lingulodinium_polyedra.AAC.1